MHLRLGGSRSVFVTTQSGYFSRLGAGPRRVARAPVVSDIGGALLFTEGPLRCHVSGGRYGAYAEWITGTPPRSVQKHNAWLLNPTYGWRAPFKLTPNEYLTVELLEAVAHVAANPAAMPTESV